MGAVPYDAEFRRIYNLPRRVWTAAHVEQYRAWLHHILRRPEGQEKLRDLQVMLLGDYLGGRRLFAYAGVGAGKTHVSLLLPSLARAQRPVLMVPASMVESTVFAYERISRHWRLHPNIKIISYESLSRANQATFLSGYQPDLIIGDECHKLSHPDAGRTRRVLRYALSDIGRRQSYVFFSGSITQRRYEEFAHLLHVTHDNGSPLPVKWHTLQQWDEATAAKLKPGTWRRSIGALQHLGGEGPDTITQARDGVRKRMMATPGVVFDLTPRLEVSLIIKEKELNAPPEVHSAIRQLIQLWTTPNNEELTTAFEVWRHGRELTCGFYQRWTPPAPPAWQEPRKQWARFVRGKLGTCVRTRDHYLDTPAQVEAQYPGHPTYHDWLRVRDTFIPNPVPYWLSDYMIQDAAKWLRNTRDGRQGIAWVEHPEVGAKLAAAAGVPYFGAGTGAAVEYHKGPLVASIAAHGTGKNLQYGHNRMLVLSNPPSGKTWEQMLGRVHRQGQTSEQVTVEYYAHTEPAQQAMESALTDAIYAQQTEGEKRLLYADHSSKHINLSQWRSAA